VFEAAFYGITEIVRESLALGADVHMGDGIVVLMSAGNSHAESVKVLLAEGADVYSSAALLSAAREGHTDTVRALLEAGAYGRPAAQREAQKNGTPRRPRF
jgi:ankyrin repeat protein